MLVNKPFLVAINLFVITDAVTTLTYTVSSPTPSTVVCDDPTGCDITCNGDYSCERTTIDAQSASYLTLTASGIHVLEQTDIYCPYNGECSITVTGSFSGASINVYCGTDAICYITGHGKESLFDMEAHAETSTKLIITADGGFETMANILIYCPRSQAQPSCIARVRSDSSPYFTSGPILGQALFYVESINDVEFQRDADANWDALFGDYPQYSNAIYYHSNTNSKDPVCVWQLGTYSSNDFFGTHSFECVKGSDINLMNGKQCVPWDTDETAYLSTNETTPVPSTSPTNYPTIQSTKSSSLIPTISSSKSITLDPSQSKPHSSEHKTSIHTTNNHLSHIESTQYLSSITVSDNKEKMMTSIHVSDESDVKTIMIHNSEMFYDTSNESSSLTSTIYIYIIAIVIALSLFVCVLAIYIHILRKGWIQFIQNKILSHQSDTLETNNTITFDAMRNEKILLGSVSTQRNVSVVNEEQGGLSNIELAPTVEGDKMDIPHVNVVDTDACSREDGIN